MKPHASVFIPFAMMAAFGCAGYDSGAVVVTPPTVATAQYAQPVPAATYYGRGWRDPAVTAAEIRSRADRIEEGARADAARGRMGGEAIQDLLGRRQYVEQMISQYSADGAINRDERRHLVQLTDQMDEARDRWRGRGIGGGPYSPPPIAYPGY